MPISSARFSATHRLLREDGFDHVVHAENISDKYFRIFFVRGNKGNARLGIIASKKILPSAVRRNRAKRIIRETFRQHNIKACRLDLVVMVKHAYANERVARGDNLKMLFSRVENRCAEL
ncbi:MAG: ribonuclease P protein component [Gallionella sp.]|nr:MAG: ribonuclease P protein component [Gallionella sp.]